MMKDTDKNILEGIIQRLPLNIYNGRIYSDEVFKKYLENEDKKLKQELRIKKIKRLYK